MNEKIAIREERLSAEEYIDFLKRTDLGSQYPKERFESRIAKLVNTVSISLVARNEEIRGRDAVQQNRMDGIHRGIGNFVPAG